MKFAVIFLSLLFCFPVFSNEWLDKSDTVFFPKDFAKTFTTYKAFSVFWWNFFVIESETDEETFEISSQVCANLKKSPHFSRVECQQDLKSLEVVLNEWVEDLPLREVPPENYSHKIEAAKARLSLPLPEELFERVRKDPFASFEGLQSLVERNIRIGLSRTAGFFFDPTTHRSVIPVQVKFSPSESDKLTEFVAHLRRELPRASQLFFFGPHGSTLTNKNQISKDLEWVSWVGVAVLLGSMGFLFWVRRLQMAWVFVPVLISTVLSYLTMILCFGKVHGLTLAFGPGLVGLVIDYGLLAIFNPRKKNIWRSNFIGFLTTLVCLFIISFSSIPLLRELMIFSIFGFVYGFLLLYFTRNWLERTASCEPHSLQIPQSKLLFFTSLFSVASCLLLFITDLKLDFRQFDFQHPRQAPLMEWIFKGKYTHPPLFQSFPLNTSLEELHEQKKWATNHEIDLETIAHYLPPLEIQERNLKRWKNYRWNLGVEEKKLFDPFWKTVTPENLKGKGVIKTDASRSYLKHLQGQENLLTLWLPKTPEEADLIKKQYPTANTLAEVTDLFPLLLISELRWIFPLSLFSIVLFLSIYYRSIKMALLGLLPFFSSLGVVLLACKLGIFSLSFVTLVGLVMILGLSVDYAVFVLDKELNTEEVSPGTVSGLFYAAGTTILGFLPLLFCSHQVLYHLGASLCFGTLGTVLGAFWGIPWFVKRK